MSKTECKQKTKFTYSKTLYLTWYPDTDVISNDSETEIDHHSDHICTFVYFYHGSWVYELKKERKCKQTWNVNKNRKNLNKY